MYHDKSRCTACAYRKGYRQGLKDEVRKQTKQVEKLIETINDLKHEILLYENDFYM